MTEQEINNVLTIIEDNLGKDFTKKEIDDLRNYLMLLMARRNELVGKIKNKVSEPTTFSETRENWYDNLYVDYSKGMIIPFSNLNDWNERIKDSGLIEGEDFEIIPPDLLIRSDPNADGIIKKNGLTEINLTWDYVEPINFESINYPLGKVKINADAFFDPIPFASFFGGSQGSPSESCPEWLDTTSCFKVSWFSNGKLETPIPYSFKKVWLRHMGIEGTPQPIFFGLGDEVEELSLYKNDGTYLVTDVSVGLTVQPDKNYKDTFTIGVLDPKPIPLTTTNFKIFLVRILKDVRIKPGELVTLNEPLVETFESTSRQNGVKL